MPQGEWQPVISLGDTGLSWGGGCLDTVLSVLTGLSASFSGVFSSHPFSVVCPVFSVSFCFLTPCSELVTQFRDPQGVVVPLVTC